LRLNLSNFLRAIIGGEKVKVLVCDKNALPLWFKPIQSMQYFLRSISRVYTNIPSVIDDGIFSETTTVAVRSFQAEFGLVPSGVIDLATWNRILLVYRELESLRIGSGEFNLGVPDGEIILLRLGDEDSCLIGVVQGVLSSFAASYANMPPVELNGVYDEQTAEAVRQFQKLAGLGVDDEGTLDRRTWNAMLRLYDSCYENAASACE
jgi:peptidoglycan hydrolase-like protein with peptidoglycan-binding domain